MLKKQATKQDFGILTKKKPEKRLTKGLPKKAGRGRAGKITVRHKGRRAKRLYRIVDFGQEKINIPAKVIGLEYDPSRTSFIALLEYEDGDRRYRIAPQNLKVGDKVICAAETELRPGNRMKLKNIPVGTSVYNIEIEPGRGGKMVRGAGTLATVLAQEGKYTHLKMPSKEIRMVLKECFASVGAVSRPKHIYTELGKAGRTRWRGIRPTVRGTAMGPVDHPHGGGEGKAPIGLPYPKTPWGKPAKGIKTRRRKWTNRYIIKRRKKK